MDCGPPACGVICAAVLHAHASVADCCEYIGSLVTLDRITDNAVYEFRIPKALFLRLTSRINTEAPQNVSGGLSRVRLTVASFLPGSLHGSIPVKSVGSTPFFAQESFSGQCSSSGRPTGRRLVPQASYPLPWGIPFHGTLSK
jgi:hypothetical protein